MRFLFTASWEVEAGNARAKNDTLGSTVESIISRLKPEAAYFLADNGKRTAHLIVNMEDASQMPAVAEPWFLAFNASVEFKPVMIVEDLVKAGPAIGQAAKMYG